VRKRGAYYLGICCLLWACQMTVPEGEGSLNETGGTRAETLEVVEQKPPVDMDKVLADYDAFVRAKMDSLRLPGLAYAVVKDGKVVALKTYGVRHKGRSAPIDEHTAFRLASVSKGFASVLAGALVEKGYLYWDDPIKKHIPSFRLKTNLHTSAVTLRHSLSHSTGLTEYAGVSLIYKDWSCGSLLKGLRTAAIAAPPADSFTYQNVIYSAIDIIAKTVTQKSYSHLVDSLLLEPLGMEDASLGYNSMANRKNKAMPHTYSSRYGWTSKGSIRNKWYNVAPAAGMNASISDMAIWLQAMLGHRPEVVSKYVLNEIFVPHIAINSDSKYYETWAPGITQGWYGLGWRIFDYNNTRVVYHGGYLRGFRPEMGFCPSEDVGIVMLTNASKNDLSTMCIPTFFKLYFDLDTPPSTQPADSLHRPALHESTYIGQ
jgi:beta-lactamase class C